MLKELKNSMMTKTTTENGAITNITTENPLLDFFSQAGAMRTRNEDDIYSMFNAAFKENPLYTLKCLFYIRDIRGGQGERRTFNIILNKLANDFPDVIIKNLSLIKEYGRWDDYYNLVDTKCEKQMFDFLHKQFVEDLLNLNEDNKSISLLGKWLKSENASSKKTIKLAKLTRKYFELDAQTYRQNLSFLRDKIKIIETNLTKKDYENIEYNKIPSRASLIYREAFKRHDNERYSKYIEDVKNGKEKINASTLYPYDIVNKVLYENKKDDTIKVLWDNLPNYIVDENNEPKKENSIAVVDTSGSMTGLPMCVSLGLGIYLAEKNEGPFHNHFITFSRNPVLQEIRGTNIIEKIHNLQKADWDMNTNIEKVFDVILQTAINNKIKQDDMIQKIYIISDMEFDSATLYYDGGKTLFEKIKTKYNEHDYQMPKLIFWNVDSRNKQFPVKMSDTGVQLVSGCSPSIFKTLMQNKNLSAYDLMIDVLDNERYKNVSI